MTIAAPGDPDRPLVQWGRPFRAAASLLMGGALLWIAVPQTVAAWNARDATPVVNKLNGDLPVSEAEFDTGAEALKRALSWAPSARRLTDLGFVEARHAVALEAGDRRRQQLLADAEQNLSSGLVLNPGDGWAWLRLASVRQLRGQEGRAVAAPLMQSLDVAPNVRRIWIPRAEMLMRNQQFLDKDELDSVRRQIRAIWSTEPPWPEPADAYKESLTEAGARAGGWLLIAAALGSEQDQLAEFDKFRTAYIRKLLKR